jgi:Gram-negative porin
MVTPSCWSNAEVRPLVTLLLALAFSPAAAQVVLKHDRATLTLEGWANGAWSIGDGVQTDGAVRALGLVAVPGPGRIGARVVAEGEAGVTDELGIGERTLLWTGALGRLEYGRRQGLPDVLTGYAPNPFTFTTAEFGPASGLALDPAGGIVSRFLPEERAARYDRLALLGYGPAAFSDRSRKLLYVAPKRAGWLGGVSYAAEEDLLQAGLVHETYSGQNVVRSGGSWSQSETSEGERFDSFHVGASIDIDQVWMLGIAATADDAESDARGVTASINWNRGPWTIGGYLQAAAARSDADASRDRLRVIETGLSYRTSTKLRLFAAWHHYRLAGASDTANDDLLILGARLTI